MKALRIITILIFIISLLVYGGVHVYYQYSLDRVPPVIQCDDTVLQVSVNADEKTLLEGVTAADDRDGDLTDQIMIQGISRLLTSDTARITYVVFDASENMASRTRTIQYTDYERPRIQLDQAPVFAPVPSGDPLVELGEALKAVDVRDGDISGNIRITAQNVDMYEEGIYRVNVQVSNSMGDTEVVPLTVVLSNENADEPLIQLSSYITYVSAGSEFHPAEHITAVDGSSYRPSDKNLKITSNVDTAAAGTYEVCYSYKTYTVYMTVVVR